MLGYYHALESILNQDPPVILPPTEITLPFGRVVAQKPADPGVIQIASPSIVKLSNGTILVSHDYPGTYNGGSFNTSAVYKSTDEGITWEFITDIVGMFWGKLFTYNGDVYILGVSQRFTDLAITKSTDNGETWSAPVSVITDIQGGWHKAPASILIKDGYLLCSPELAADPFGFAEGFQAVFAYGDLTDLLNPSNWGHTTPLAFDGSQYPITIGDNSDATKYPPVGGQLVSKGFLEGNVVEKPGGGIAIIYRLEQTPNSNYAVILDVNWNSVTPANTTINPSYTFIEMPGGNIKFSIIDDRANSGKYWAVSNVNRYRHYADNRIEQFLLSSDDLITWKIHDKVAGYTPGPAWENEIEVQGVQYTDLFVDGNDLLLATRTSPAVVDGGTGEWHDAALTTFSRVSNFRNSLVKTYVSGSLIIDENSPRIEDGNGIGVIEDQTKYFNSPFSLTSENGSKVPWANGLNFNGSNHLKIKHNEYLNPDNGLTVFVVVENLQNTGGGLRILSKSDSGSDITTKGWKFSAEGLSIGDTFGSGQTDLSIGESYIFAGSFDPVNNDIYNYLNGQNRGEPPTLSGGTFLVDKVRKTTPYEVGNISDLFVGKRGEGTALNFTSLVKAIHVFPSYMTPTEIEDYTDELNSVYNIFSEVTGPAPVDNTADLNVYFDTSKTTPGLGTFASPYARNAELSTHITNNSSPGDVITLWVTGNGNNNPAISSGYGYVGSIPAGRTYRFKHYGNQSVSSGAKRITGAWTDMGNDVYRADLSEVPYNLLVNGAMVKNATDYSLYDFTDYDFANGVIESANLSGVYSNGDLIGARIDALKNSYNPFRAFCTGFTDGSPALIEIDNNIMPEDVGPESDYHIQIYNLVSQLQPANTYRENNMWAYDPVNNHLYLYSIEDPATKTVDAVIVPNFVLCGTVITDDVSISMEGLYIKNFALDGIRAKGAVHDCVIVSNTFENITRNGLTLEGAFDPTLNHSNQVNNNNFYGYGAGAIWMRNPHQAEVIGNTGYCFTTQEHLGLYKALNDGVANDGATRFGCSITLENYVGQNDSQSIVESNVFTRSMKHGLAVAGLSNTIQYNKVSNFGQLVSDFGGIYVSGWWSRLSTLYRNTVFNKLGSTRLIRPSAGIEYAQGFGIYFDFLCDTNYARENTIYGTDGGVVCSLGNENTEITDNKLAGNRVNVVIFHQFAATIDPSDNVTVTGNEMFLTSPEQKQVEIIAPFDPGPNPIDYGTIDNNRYVYMVRGAAFTPNLFGLNSTRMGQGVSFECWKHLTGYDQSSIQEYVSTPEMTVTNEQAITDNFSGPEVLTTTTAAGDIDNGTSPVITLSGGNNTIGDQEVLKLTVSADSTRSGGMLEFRVFGPTIDAPGLRRDGTIETKPGSEDYEIFWLNDTGAPVEITTVIFRARGIDGTSYTQNVTGFAAVKCTLDELLQVQLLETSQASEIFPGTFTLFDGSTVNGYEVFLNDPKLTVNLTPKYLADADFSTPAPSGEMVLAVDALEDQLWPSNGAFGGQYIFLPTNYYPGMPLRWVIWSGGSATVNADKTINLAQNEGFGYALNSRGYTDWKTSDNVGIGVMILHLKSGGYVGSAARAEGIAAVNYLNANYNVVDVIHAGSSLGCDFIFRWQQAQGGMDPYTYFDATFAGDGSLLTPGEDLTGALNFGVAADDGTFDDAMRARTNDINALSTGDPYVMMTRPGNGGHAAGYRAPFDEDRWVTEQDVYDSINKPVGIMAFIEAYLVPAV